MRDMTEPGGDHMAERSDEISDGIKTFTPFESSCDMDHEPAAIDSYSSKESVPPDTPPPNGGWGWAVVFGSLVVHIIVFGIERSAGIFYLKFDDKFHQTATVTAWIASFPCVLRTLLAPVCGLLIVRFSCRIPTIVGAVLLCLSMILTSFSNDLEFSLFSYSLLGGIGMCLVYCPAVVVVSQYFTARRGLATGIATSSFGSFLFPTIIEFLFDYYGFLGTFLILAGLTLNAMVCGSLFRPLPITDITKRKEAKNQDEYTEEDVGARNCCICPGRLSGDSQCGIKKKIISDLRFPTFIAAIGLLGILFQSAFTFIPLYAKQINIEEQETTFIVGVALLSDTFGRISFGAIFDSRFVKTYRIIVYNVFLLILGITALVFPSTDTILELCVVCAAYGFASGCVISQKTVVLVDIIGINHLPEALGITLLFQGIGFLIGPLISGYIKDTTSVIDGGFYFGGISTIVGAAIFASANIIHHFKSKREVPAVHSNEINN